MSKKKESSTKMKAYYAKRNIRFEILEGIQEWSRRQKPPVSSDQVAINYLLKVGLEADGIPVAAK
jgi:hypothetical protein